MDSHIRENKNLGGKNNSDHPLVSIIVITYNSSKYVLETLESVKDQTYQNIELIVSDDCSTDCTVEICSKWIECNKERFIRTELITALNNTGISANCNRGLNTAKGLWIKYIAGDDMLVTGCISEFIKEINKLPGESFFVSEMYVLKDQVISEKISPNPEFLKRNSKSQFKYMAIFLFYIPSPAVMFKTETLRLFKGFDERYKFVEDLPLFMKITAAGYRFNHIHMPLIVYRRHDESITNQNSNVLQESFKKFFKEDFYTLLLDENMLLLLRHYRLEERLINSSNYKEKLFYSIIMRLTDPFTWYFKYQKIVNHLKPWNAAMRITIPEKAHFKADL